MVCTLVGMVALALGASPDATASKTDPKTWSTFGALEVKFGMGPGDVRAKHPSAKVESFWSGLVDDGEVDKKARAAGCPPYPHVFWEGRTKLFGSEVELDFQFFDGRLYRFRALCNWMSAPRVSNRSTAHGCANARAFSEKVLDALRAKYGEPMTVLPAEAPGQPPSPKYRWKVSPGTVVEFFDSFTFSSVDYADEQAQGAAEAFRPQRDWCPAAYEPSPDAKRL